MASQEGTLEEWRSAELTRWWKERVFGDFKDTAYPFFESDTLFLECFV